MNKINLLLMGALAICAGCATKEMKSTPFYTGDQVTYTGRIEDRVNLWPAAYYREPVGSVAWPLLSFSNDHFALRPLYSQYKQDGVTGRYDEFNVLWPICQFDTKHGDYRIFPMFWDDNSFNLFPLVWYKQGDHFVLFPEFWWTENTFALLPLIMDRDFDGMSIFPIFWGDFKGNYRYNTLFPLYWYSSDQWEGKNGEQHSRRTFWAGAGLGGFRQRNGKTTASWLLPLYAAGKDSFYSIPYSHLSESDGDETTLFMMGLAAAHERESNGDETTRILLGLAGETATKDGYESSWCFPLYYHDRHNFITALYGNTDDSDWLLPLYYRGPNRFLTALYGRDQEVEWLLPLYWRDQQNFLSLLYCQENGAHGRLASWTVPPLLTQYRRAADGSDHLDILLGLAGHATAADGAGKAWTFPLFYWDDDLFVTPLFGKTKTSDWFIPIYYRDPENLFALGLYGQTEKANWLLPLFYNSDDLFLTPLYGKTKSAEWLFPLYYRDEDGFVTPLGGGTANSHWLLPLYYKNGEDFVSLPYIRDVKGDTTTHIVPPLLSSFTRNAKTDEKEDCLLLGLAGYATDPQGEHTRDWLLPLYARAKDKWFLSLAAGYTGGGTSQTNTWWCTPLVGTKSGRRDGCWLFPLLDHESAGSADGGYSKLAALARQETLPPEIVFEPKTIKQTQWEPARTKDGRSISKPVEVSKTILSTPDRRASEKTTLLLLNKHRKSVNARMDYDNKNYRVSASRESGNALLMKHSRETTACFDPQTRKRKSVSKSRELNVLLNLVAHWKSRSDTADRSRSWDLSLLTVLFNGDGKTYQDGKSRGSANVLGLLYNSEWSLDGDEESSILWRVWHRERKNGHVTVDMFPGITYDAKKDGYCQTSFLWRFFRYQNEPGKGVSLDLFFLPLKRP